MFKITSKQSFTEDTFAIHVHMPAIVQNAKPGHYVDLHVNPDSVPVTAPVADVDTDAGTFCVVVKACDLPSEQLMMLSEGDQLFQVRGPLGTPSTVRMVNKAVFVAEDIGVASAYWRARSFKDEGAYVISVLGYQTGASRFWDDRFSAISDEVYVVTHDGEFGISGHVGGALKAICETHRDIDHMTAIAGMNRMKRAAKLADEYGIMAVVNFDAILKPHNQPTVFDAWDEKTVFDFVRAPEIDAQKVEYDKLMGRQRAINNKKKR